MTRLSNIACALLAATISVAAHPGATPGTTQPPAATTPDHDALFAQPYIDADEWRNTPVRHRYVHGGFKGTDTRFSFYLPPKSQYQGRFFQHFTPTPDSENLAQQMPAGEDNKIGFAIASGGYFVETNGGGRNNTSGPAYATDPTISAWRANAAAAEFSRVVARKMYGGRRPFGYAFGGSGGAYRTVGAFENTHGVWDGVVPYVLGNSNAAPSHFTVRLQAMRLLHDKFPQIVDALEPGGNGNPFAGLNDEQTMALREATRMGFPPQSWFGWKTMGIHGFAAIYGGMLQADPGYFTDFWSKPGYRGHDEPASFTTDRIQLSARIVAPINAAQAAQAGLDTSIVNGRTDGGVDTSFAALQGAAGKRVVAFRLDKTPPDTVFLGGDLFVDSGAAQGQRLTVKSISGDMVVLGLVDADLAGKIAPGDQVRLDNSNFLAAESYHRHQSPGPEFVGWDQFTGPDGKPLYPQSRLLLGPLFTRGAAGTVPQGVWQGKMILVESLWDREAYAWSADWYRRLVARHLGAATDQHFRVWMTDHALHGDTSTQEDPTHTVSYMGVLHQALRDLAAWVEKGVPPPASTNYRVVDAQVVVPSEAGDRRGIQPVVALAINGKPRADISAGQAVTLRGTITVPPGTGSIVAVRWDFDGSGRFAAASPIHTGARALTVTVTHRFSQPGTYFPTLKGISQRQGDTRTPYARIENLARVRVVVR